MILELEKCYKIRYQELPEYDNIYKLMARGATGKYIFETPRLGFGPSAVSFSQQDVDLYTWREVDEFEFTRLLS